MDRCGSQPDWRLNGEIFSVQDVGLEDQGRFTSGAEAIQFPFLVAKRITTISVNMGSMRRPRCVVFAFFYLPAILFSQHGQEPLIELDKPLAWAHTKESNVYRASGNKHVYFLLPSSVDVIFEDHGAPAFSFAHHGITCRDDRGSGATLIATVKPVFGLPPTFGSGSADDVKAAVTAYDPKAIVIVPVPLNARWELLLQPPLGMGSFQDNSSPSENSLTAPRSFEARLSRIGAWPLLLSTFEGDLLGARLTFRLRGKISHHSTPVERELSAGMTFAFSCTKYPGAFKDLTLGGTGCLVPQKEPKPFWLGGTSCGTTAYPPH